MPARTSKNADQQQPTTADLGDQFRVEVLPIRKVIANMQAYDSNVLVNANPLASKYPRIKARMEEYLKRIAGIDAVVAFFNADDLPSRHEIGYYPMSTGNFDAEAWPPGIERELGVWVDATNAIRVDNKYVCFILRERREQWLEAAAAASERMLSNARKAAGKNKPFTQTSPGEYGAQFEDQVEVIQHQKRKQVEQPDEAQAPE